jgi:hypothetical protein
MRHEIHEGYGLTGVVRLKKPDASGCESIDALPLRQQQGLSVFGSTLLETVPTD